MYMNFLKIKYVIGGIILILFFILTLMFGIPQYKIWSAEQAGKAQLAEAEQNRQIAIQEANAKKESAKLLAEAEVERAKGLAEANRIIADSLDGKDEYIRYLMIDALKETQNQVIYIPMDGTLPVTESFRLYNQNSNSSNK